MTNNPTTGFCYGCNGTFPMDALTLRGVRWLCARCADADAMLAAIDQRLARLEAQCSHQTASEPEQKTPTWPLPTRPPNSAAREPGQRGGDGSSGGGLASSTIADQPAMSADLSITNAPTADPVGVPELDRWALTYMGQNGYYTMAKNPHGLYVHIDDHERVVAELTKERDENHRTVLALLVERDAALRDRDSLRERCERAERERAELSQLLTVAIEGREQASDKLDAILAEILKSSDGTKRNYTLVAGDPVERTTP